jgi:hypothetical protein
MNSKKSLIVVAALFATGLPTQAQSILEDLILESVDASLILRQQGDSDVSTVNGLPGSPPSIADNDKVFIQISKAARADQTGHPDIASWSNNEKSSSTDFNAITFANILTTETNLTLSQPVQFWDDTNSDFTRHGNPRKFYRVIQGWALPNSSVGLRLPARLQFKRNSAAEHLITKIIN